jgi:hypothetical protein
MRLQQWGSYVGVEKRNGNASGLDSRRDGAEQYAYRKQE